MLGKKKKRKLGLLVFFKHKKTNTKKKPEMKELRTQKIPSYLKKKLQEIKQNYNVEKLLQLLNEVLNESGNTNKIVNKLTGINKILSHYENRDIAVAIEYLTKNEKFFEILLAITNFYYDEDTNGRNYLHHLSNLKDFLLKYIRYFPSDKLCCDTMREIFGLQGSGRFLVAEYSYPEEFIRVAITKKNMQFLVLVLSAANQGTFIDILNQQRSKNPHAWNEMLTSNQKLKDGCKNSLEAFNQNNNQTLKISQ